ncbi:MAG: amidohydrolase family protein [Clostridiaceae bacterium]|nr:amidohydrolase family protein [Clostridiaceae bacterium]
MLLIKNGKILTMTGTDYENGYIIINDAKIVEVGEGDNYLKNELYIKHIDNGKNSNGDRSPDSCSIDDCSIRIIDAKGNYVLPGYIDAHCHVGMWEDSTGFEGSDGNEATDPVTPQLRAIDGVYPYDRYFTEARENGVTTVITGPGSANVIGGQFAALKTYGKRVEDMIVKEPVAVKVAFGENPKTVYGRDKKMPSTRMATAAILRENLIKAREYKKSKEESEKDKSEKGKFEYDMKMEALVKVLDREIPLKAHAHRADDILTAIRIAKEFGINLTIEHCTEGHLIADILVEEGISAINGPFLSDRSKPELRNLSAKTPGILSKAGVKVAIMTDHPVIPVSSLWLCAAIAVREGMDEKEAFKAITINAAEITGVSHRVGSLEKGKDADIVIYNGHPFDIKTRVSYTIINGEVVYFDKAVNNI